MNSFSITIEYLTGYAVATMSHLRGEPEWPPHPARVFMALAAAHFECTDETVDLAAEREMLDWLAGLAPPALEVPTATTRSVPTVYVPVNDQKAEEALVKRSRQPRFFPRVHVGDHAFRLVYQAHAPDANKYLGTLESLCARVARIGHSSSLVWVRIDKSDAAHVTHVADPASTDRQLRVASQGLMNRLESFYNARAIEEYFVLNNKKDAAKGIAKKQAATELAAKFPNGQPMSQRPTVSLRMPYRQVDVHAEGPIPSSIFDPNFLVLRTGDASTQIYGLESTSSLAKALIGLLMGRIDASATCIPEWISGHEPNGDPLRSGSHIAVIPLAFVGRPWIDVERHARGQLMGLGLLIPKEVPLRERSKLLSPIFFDENGQPRELQLNLGRKGEWSILRDTSTAPKLSLRTSTYTEASRVWASVTPVVLDRMPKVDRKSDPIGWRAEVAEGISTSCRHAKLPEPIAVRVEKTPFFIGSERAMPGQGGFPLLRQGRFQVHAQLTFAEPIAGPVLIGAGRFRGYGLMRPWKESKHDTQR